MAVSETLRSVIDAGVGSKRLDELSSARVIGKIAVQAHAAQQKAGAGKAIGPFTPAHITILASGEVKLETSGGGSSLGYRAPEQITGGSGDRRSDVFSLGTVMWEALTHTRLFDAMNDAAVKAAVQEREIASPSEMNANIPAELSAICMRALSRNPADRYGSLKSMAVEIEEFLEEAGYTDDDAKIAQYLAGIGAVTPAKRSPIVVEPVTPTPSTTVAVAAAPPPSILTEPPVEPSRAKRLSGIDVAAALATAGSSGAASTAVGIPAAPVPEDWQDKAAPVHPPMPSAAPVAPLVPKAPVLPAAAYAPTERVGSATITASIAPQVKVATATEASAPVEAPAPATPAPAPTPAPVAATAPTPPPAASVEAKHAEPKAAAVDLKQTLIGISVAVEPKVPAVDTLVDKVIATPPAAAPVETTPEVNPQPTAAAVTVSVAEDLRTTLVDTKPPEFVTAVAPPILPSTGKAEPAARPAAKKSDAPANVRASSQSEGVPATAKESGSKPNPVDAVSLPGRESKADVLAGWGWGTGKHDAIAPENYEDAGDDAYEQPSNRKPLMYAIGGGLAVALVITIVAFADGGSKDKPKQPQTAKSTATDATKAQATETPTPVETPAAGSASIDAAADPAAAEAAAKAEAEKTEAAREAEVAAAEAARIEAEKLDAENKALVKEEVAKAEAARKAQEKAQTAELAKTEADKKELAKQEAAAKAKADAAAKAEAAKLAKADAAAKAEAARVAKAETAKTEAAKRLAARSQNTTTTSATAEPRTKTTTKTAPTTTKSDPKTTRTDPKTAAKGDPTKTGGSVDVETAYRIGLQQFARGDTAGALASLRTSLAGNPNYAPTWRGLGLVFEKMGEKDQAKSAYKRYLLLAPSAGDAEIIRGRLERLGS